ncbi:MAG: hypothetical protein WA188_14695 [Terriglobales bacterium]
MPFEKGQQVLIKNAGDLEGIVVGPRPADKGLPEEETCYLVQIFARCYRSTGLEPAEEPSEKLERSSQEWLAESNRLLEAAQRWIANPNDRAAHAQFYESCGRLGVFVPIE